MRHHLRSRFKTQPPPAPQELLEQSNLVGWDSIVEQITLHLASESSDDENNSYMESSYTVPGLNDSVAEEDILSE